MNNRTILYVMNTETPDAEISKMADAAVLDGTHLVCLILGKAPPLPMYAYGAVPYGGINVPDHWAELAKEAQTNLKNRVNAVEALLAKSGASGQVNSTLAATVDIKHRAKEFGADLVVMGAYGHARVIQTILGGTTRTMIEQTELPVLVAH